MNDNLNNRKFSTQNSSTSKGHGWPQNKQYRNNDATQFDNKSEIKESKPDQNSSNCNQSSYMNNRYENNKTFENSRYNSDIKSSRGYVSVNSNKTEAQLKYTDAWNDENQEYNSHNTQSRNNDQENQYSSNVYYNSTSQNNSYSSSQASRFESSQNKPSYNGSSNRSHQMVSNFYKPNDNSYQDQSSKVNFANLSVQNNDSEDNGWDSDPMENPKTSYESNYETSNTPSSFTNSDANRKTFGDPNRINFSTSNRSHGEVGGFKKNYEDGSNSRGRGYYRNKCESEGTVNKSNWNNRSDNESTYKADREDQQQSTGGQSNYRQRDVNEVREEFNINSDMVGSVIGKGGSVIKEIKETSGAVVFITKDDDPSGLRKVIIRGSKEAVLKARKAIDDIIASKTKPSFFTTNEKSENAGDTSVKVDWVKAKEMAKEYEKVKWAGYPPIEKNFYLEDSKVAQMDKETVAKIRKENNNISVVNLSEKEEFAQIPNPVTTFQQAFFHFPEILNEIKKAKFEYPSPIQKQAWPIIMSGRDLIGIAQTGTGKTLAFLLPAFIHIEGQPVPRSERCGPSVLILTPTRELALQIEEEIKKYKYRGIKCVCIYGGGSRRDQINIVSKGVEIVVATPGRLNDLIMNEILNVRSVTYLVLDEADRMLDLGFEPEIRKAVIHIRPDRQTIMTSATWPDGVRRLSTSFMNNPLQVFVGSLDLTAVHSVEQRIQMIEEDEKLNELIEILMNRLLPDDKAIVFMGRKNTVDQVSAHFALEDLVACQSIHGGREQCDREQALEDFKSGRVKVLLATDVASRGIDVKDITLVINYDFPHNIEEYVHRVGRTGRAGRTGISLTFLTRSDWKYAAELIGIMEEAEQEVPQVLYDMSSRYSAMLERRRLENGDSHFGSGRGGGGGRERGFGRRHNDGQMKVVLI